MGKDRRFFVFLAGLIMLAVFVLIVALYREIHKSLIFEDEQETEEVQEDEKEEI